MGVGTAVPSPPHVGLLAPDSSARQAPRGLKASSKGDSQEIQGARPADRPSRDRHLRVDLRKLCDGGITNTMKSCVAAAILPGTDSAAILGDSKLGRTHPPCASTVPNCGASALGSTATESRPACPRRLARMTRAAWMTCRYAQQHTRRGLRQGRRSNIRRASPTTSKFPTDQQFGAVMNF